MSHLSNLFPSSSFKFFKHMREGRRKKCHTYLTFFLLLHFFIHILQTKERRKEGKQCHTYLIFLPPSPPRYQAPPSRLLHAAPLGRNSADGHHRRRQQQRGCRQQALPRRELHCRALWVRQRVLPGGDGRGGAGPGRQCVHRAEAG